MDNVNVLLATVVVREVLRVAAVLLALIYLTSAFRQCGLNLKTFNRPVALLALFTCLGYGLHYLELASSAKQWRTSSEVSTLVSLILILGITTTLYLSTVREVWARRKNGGLTRQGNAPREALED